jgi:fumarylacetoacetase
MPNAEFQPDATTNPALRSWVASANEPTTDFPIQNLPLCSFEHPEEEYSCLGVRIGDKVLDLGLLAEAGVFEHDHGSEDDFLHAIEAPSVNELAALGAPAWKNLRRQVQKYLLEGSTIDGGQRARRVREKALLGADDVNYLPPALFFNYTDFYASIHHARTVGGMFRPDNPLLPNYKHVPIGYHGRASSVVVGDYDCVIRRPSGQLGPSDADLKADPNAGPTFGPCKMLDFELEVGLLVGPPNALGEPISIGRAHEHILGLCLVNDWSARDIQKWEYQPLGPFLAKNFATGVSPCVVMMDALAPFRVPATPRPAGDPRPLEYLWDTGDQEFGAFDITLEVLIATKRMLEADAEPVRISRVPFRDMYWTFAQMLAHHTSNGCNLQPGDLIASGTVSGQSPDARGCLLEATWQGLGADGKPLPRKPIELPTGETRTFLQDGDEVILRGLCEREGFRRIGFGECRGVVEG